MLKSYLTSVPCTKFVLIEDSLENRGSQILEYIVFHHLTKNENKIHFLVFEGCIKRSRNRFAATGNLITFHDFIKNGRNWIIDETQNKEVNHVISTICIDNSIIIIDSLANFVLRYGISETYRLFNAMKNNPGVLQVITVLHEDLFESDADSLSASQYFKHLSTLSLKLETKFLTNNGRLEYVYKKKSGKIIRDIEEYRFEGKELFTEKVQKLDPKKLLEKSLAKEVNPENLSTFRIGLTEKEKLSRDKVVLPYLPKPENNSDEQNTGQILYNLDEVDDWDEEDPDDDLDI